MNKQKSACVVSWLHFMFWFHTERFKYELKGKNIATKNWKLWDNVVAKRNDKGRTGLRQVVE